MSVADAMRDVATSLTALAGAMRDAAAAHEALDDARAASAPVGESPSALFARCCGVMGLDIAVVRGKSKAQSLAAQRKVIALVLRTNGASQPEIGDVMHRDSSTVNLMFRRATPEIKRSAALLADKLGVGTEAARSAALRKPKGRGPWRSP